MDDAVLSAMKSDLTAIADNVDHLDGIFRVANEIGAVASLATLAAKIASQIDVPSQKIRNVLSGIWNLHGFISNDADPPIALDRLVTQVASDWSQSTQEKWDRARTVLLERLSEIDEDHVIFTAIKAHRLAYSHERLFVSSQVATDIRPVFDSKAERILESVIVHTLSIQYTSGWAEPTSISIALDEADIESLVKCLERARLKTRAITRIAASLTPISLPERPSSGGA